MRTRTPLILTEERVLQKAVLMKEINAQLLEEWQNRDQSDANGAGDGVHVCVEYLQGEVEEERY